MSDPATIQPFASGTASLALSHRDTEMRHFVNDIDYLVRSVDINRIERLSFIVGDVPYTAAHKKDPADGEARICISAIFGFLPYSAEDNDRRQAILSIIAATRSLFHVRFGIDPGGRIFAAGNFTTDTLTAPDFIFYPLISFLQEAQPFIGLIGQYL